MAIYFLRHGESVANLEGLFAGQKNNAPLTELGIEQARTAGKELSILGIQRIVTSSLKRTMQTAIEVSRIINFDTSKIEQDDRIIEYDMGELTGMPNRKITSLELTSALGAEDPVEFSNRILEFLKEYSNSDETILIVSHAGVGRAIESAKQGLNPAEFYDLPAYPNAHAVLLDLSWLSGIKRLKNL